MKTRELQTLEAELLQVVSRVLEDNNADMTKKISKIVKKSIKRIVKKNDSQVKKANKNKKQYSF